MKTDARGRIASVSGRTCPDAPRDVTIAIPAYNEEGDIEGSYREIAAVFDATGLDYEFLFVDDGSSDATWQIIQSLSRRDPRVRGIRHRGNSGKASALGDAFANACGDIVAICDADMQYDPRDIIRVVDKVREGFDAVSAHKVVRRDPLSKRLPSRFFNFFVRNATGVELHDMNAGLKAFRRDAAEALVQYGYGELHRFFIVILSMKGFSVAEVPVESRPRLSGRSKYGIERYLRGAMDFLTVFFLSRYMQRPLHLFGGVGVGSASLGGTLGVYAVATGALNDGRVGTPLLVMAALLFFGGLQLIVLGLLAEMLTNIERGPLARGSVSEVIRVERRTGAETPFAVERRRPPEEAFVLHTAAEERDVAEEDRAERPLVYAGRDGVDDSGRAAARRVERAYRDFATD